MFHAEKEATSQTAQSLMPYLAGLQGIYCLKGQQPLTQQAQCHKDRKVGPEDENNKVQVLCHYTSVEFSGTCFLLVVFF